MPINLASIENEQIPWGGKNTPKKVENLENNSL